MSELRKIKTKAVLLAVMFALTIATMFVSMSMPTELPELYEGTSQKISEARKAIAKAEGNLLDFWTDSETGIVQADGQQITARISKKGLTIKL